MRSRIHLALAATALLLAPQGANAVSISVALGNNTPDTYGEAALGCSSAGSNGELQCTGGDLTGPLGGWTLESWNLFVDPDPTVNNAITVTNNTGVTQSFLITVVLPVNVTFGPPSLIKGSVGGSATDNNGNGVTFGTSGANPIYAALIDGGVVRTLRDPVYTLSTPNAFDTVTMPSVNFGIPIAESAGVATTTDIAITLRFSLSAGDSASLTSVFNVEPVPEPGTALLLLVGLAGMARVARRA